jgi:BMFP domain-containing protein YqiC
MTTRLPAVTGETPTLEQRVAALEETLANPLRFVMPAWDPLTPGQEAELREEVKAAVITGPFEYRILPQPLEQRVAALEERLSALEAAVEAAAGGT